MIFLPIADRELRVTARKRSTFWVRVAGASFALVVGAGCFGLMMIGTGSNAATIGRNLFAILTWFCLAAALSAGLFFTSDCLSEEKRDGTLGFLFLTSLRAHDVVIGKLLAAGLRGFYALLAVLPILAVTLLMGGVTGLAFFKTSLALLNALVASLVVGLFISAVSRDSHKALAATLLLLISWVVGGPIIDAIFARVTQRPFNPVLSISSPGYLFISATMWGPAFFWKSLLANQLILWTLVGLSCLALPRVWQDKPAGAAIPRRRFGSARRRAALRMKLMDVNPVTWLASLDGWPPIVLWAAALLMALGVIGTFIPDQRFIWMLWSYLGGLFSLIIYLFVCSQATRFFVEARRSGLLELLLATPLTAQQIVQGQWRALLRMFALPLVLFLASSTISSFMAQEETWSIAATATATIPTATGTNTAVGTNVTVGPTGAATNITAAGTLPPMPAPFRAMIYVIAGAGTLASLASILALVWFGMWMGLTSKNVSLGTLKTLFWVQILPWFGISFVAGALAALVFLPAFSKNPAIAPQTFLWFPLASAGLGILLSLGKDIFFYFFARRKLYSEFRIRGAITPGQAISAATIPVPGNR